MESRLVNASSTIYWCHPFDLIRLGFPIDSSKSCACKNARARHQDVSSFILAAVFELALKPMVHNHTGVVKAENCEKMGSKSNFSGPSFSLVSIEVGSLKITVSEFKAPLRKFIAISVT